MKLFSIPIKVNASFFSTIILLEFWRISHPILCLEWVAVVFISALIHELGHTIAGSKFGLEKEIHLYSAGGLTSWSNNKSLSTQQNIIIGLTGPFVSLIFGSLILLVKLLFANLLISPFIASTFQDLIWVNIGWGIFNLLPILPLDGGYILSNIEQWVRKKQDLFVTHIISFSFRDPSYRRCSSFYRQELAAVFSYCIRY